MEKHIEAYKYWLILGRNVKFTAALFLEIYALDMDIEAVFDLPETKLRSAGLSARCIRELVYAREKFTGEQVLRELTNNHIEPIFYFESDYPDSLKQIFDPPFILYKRGPADLNTFCVGIVGSRRMSDYGVQATERLAGDLAACGITIVSGFAIGIDAIAHKSTISRGGITIAVLGCGLNQVYPSRNLELAREIVKDGAIISEFPFDTIPAKQNFPARNRIISGLSSGLIVTEAAEGSGSLITAKSALDQNKEVFAIPGSIFNFNSRGTNNLIKAGAHVATDVKDILDELGIANTEIMVATRKIYGKSEIETSIIRCLTSEPKHIDLIIKETKENGKDVSAALTIMEISAKVKHLNNNVYRLNN